MSLSIHLQQVQSVPQLSKADQKKVETVSEVAQGLIPEIQRLGDEGVISGNPQDPDRKALIANAAQLLQRCESVRSYQQRQADEEKMLSMAVRSLEEQLDKIARHTQTTAADSIVTMCRNAVERSNRQIEANRREYLHNLKAIQDGSIQAEIERFKAELSLLQRGHDNRLRIAANSLLVTNSKLRGPSLQHGFFARMVDVKVVLKSQVFDKGREVQVALDTALYDSGLVKYANDKPKEKDIANMSYEQTKGYVARTLVDIASSLNNDLRNSFAGYSPALLVKLVKDYQDILGDLRARLRTSVQEENRKEKQSWFYYFFSCIYTKVHHANRLSGFLNHAENVLLPKLDAYKNAVLAQKGIDPDQVGRAEHKRHC